MNDHELPQRPDLYVLPLQIPHKGLTGKRRVFVDHHRAGAADALQAGAFPADPRRLPPVDIDDIIMIIQVVQYAGHGIVLRAIIFKGLPIWGADG